METLLFSPSHFPVGSRVRSYDFPGNVRWYVEGIIEEYAIFEGCKCYVIRPTLRLMAGKVDRKTVQHQRVWLVVNGTPTVSGVSTAFVQLLDQNHSYHWLDLDIAEQAAAYNMTPERFAVFMSGAAAEQEYYEQCPWMYGESA